MRSSHPLRTVFSALTSRANNNQSSQRRTFGRSGFTAIEVLLTVAIIAVTAGISVPMYRTYIVHADLETAVRQTVQALSRAQLLSRSGQENAMWGFAVPEGVLFNGDAYPVREPEFDESYPLPKSLAVSGLTSVTFQRVTGVPNQTGDIIFTSPWSGEQRIVTVALNGSVQVSGIIPASFATLTGESTSSLHAAADAGSSSAGGSLTCALSDCTGGAPGGSPVACGDGTFSGPACVRITGGICGWIWNDCPSSSVSQSSQQSAGASSQAASSNQSSAASSAASTGSASSSTSSNNSSSQSNVLNDSLCTESYRVWNDGTLETIATVDVTVDVLGSALTLTNGSFAKDLQAALGGGTPMVYASVSTDGGHAWASLFDGHTLTRGQSDTIENLPAGTPVLLRINGRQGWLFNKTFQSNDGLGHMLLLRRGDALPNVDAFKNVSALPSSLRALVNSQGILTIDADQALLLTEVGTLSKDASDYQDAVMLLHFAVKQGSCVVGNEPKFAIHFERIENTADGDLHPLTYVGNKGIAFADAQWIPLSINGTDILDSSPLLETVPGLAAERLASGTVRVLLHGSHYIGKEIADARITFEGATITGIENDTGTNATENPFDGIVNDGSSGDEVTLSADHQSVFFQARATTDDDAILIHWQRWNSSSQGSGTSTQDSALADSCAASFIRDSRGRIVLQEKADVRVHVLGSYAVFPATGAPLSIRMSSSIDGGVAWKYLYNYFDIVGGDDEILTDVPVNAVITLAAEGRYEWLFSNSAQLGGAEGRMRAFFPGEALPTIGLLTSPSQLQPFLSSMIADGKVIPLTKRSMLVLTELQNLDGTADFQDAVVLMEITKAHSTNPSCSPTSADQTSSTASASAASSSAASAIATITDPIMVICHFPPGNAQNVQTMTINSSKWPAHLLHGDRRGACENDEDGDAVLNAVDLCPGTYVPESVPTESLLQSRYAVAGLSNVFLTGMRKLTSAYTLQNTYGCSCEQIIDVAEGKSTYYFAQYPLLLQQLRGLFPFYTQGAREYGCGKTLLDIFSSLQ